MPPLQSLRTRIDRIDLQLLHVLNRRAALALRAGRLKARRGLPIFDERRERQVLRRVTQANGGPLSSDALRRIFREILRQSRRLEATTKARRRDEVIG